MEKAIEIANGLNLQVVGVDIPVNRCVLAARSLVLAAAFESGMQNDAIFSIDEYDEKTV